MSDQWRGWVRVLSGSPPLAHLARMHDSIGTTLCHRGLTHPDEEVHQLVWPGEEDPTPICPDCQALAP